MRHPTGCSPSKGTCKAYALAELMMIRNTTMLRFELSLLSRQEKNDSYVGLILSKGRQISETSKDVMIVCHKKGVDIFKLIILQQITTY